MKTLKLILSIPIFVMGFIFAWMTVQAGFEVLPHISSFWECIRTLVGMAALLFYGGLCNWLGYKLWRHSNE